uniref:Uncharacterized protein n=1 Tax=Prolemur simus TaxID=1328070 RepID=A0A8C9ALL2_PROSS
TYIPACHSNVCLESCARSGWHPSVVLPLSFYSLCDCSGQLVPAAYSLVSLSGLNSSISVCLVYTMEAGWGSSHLWS